MTHCMIEERVARGARLLDQVRPGWRTEICIGTLDIGSCTECVLGQLYGTYDDGVESAFPPESLVGPTACGFNFWTAREASLLEEAWTDEILEGAR